MLLLTYNEQVLEETRLVYNMQQQYSSHNATFGSPHAVLSKELVDKERQRTKTKYPGTNEKCQINPLALELDI